MSLKGTNQLVRNANMRIDSMCTNPTLTRSAIFKIIFNRLLFNGKERHKKRRSCNGTVCVIYISNCTLRLLSAWDPFFYIIYFISLKKTVRKMRGGVGWKGWNEENVLLLWDEGVGDGFHTIHWADQHHSRSSKQQSQLKINFMDPDPVGSTTFRPGRIPIRNNWPAN